MLEADIPIDIHSSKLMDWLINRKHVKPDWNNNLGIIRQKIDEAVNNIPKNTDISCLLSGAYIHYYHCKDIVNVLAGTEDGAKNLFESARLLCTNLFFDIPGLRKRIQKLQQAQYDYEKMETEIQKNGAMLAADFKAECDLLGIKGENIREELQAIVPDLQNVYIKVVKAAASTTHAIDLYERYKAKTNFNELGLSVLMHVIKHGNTTVYEYLYEKKPDRVILDKLAYEDTKLASNSETEDTIDFGDFDDKIDFGDRDVSAIELVSSAESETSAQRDEIIATGSEALTVLDEPGHRDHFVSDLLELQMFLKVLLSEANRARVGEIGIMGIDIDVESDDVLSSMLTQINMVLELIDGTAARKLHNIRHIPQYLDQLTQQINIKRNAIKRNASRLEYCSIASKESYQDHKAATKDLKILIDKSRQLQNQIENSISKLHNNRPVNLIVNY
uniref:Putative cdk5 activator-binding protein n=1 Tax=Xenopsylla cheopis TaxID=163159 RepID=A0A6M2DTP2_XENCH